MKRIVEMNERNNIQQVMNAAMKALLYLTRTIVIRSQTSES